MTYNFNILLVVVSNDTRDVAVMVKIIKVSLPWGSSKCDVH